MSVRLCLLVACVLTTSAQQTFEVASIKPQAFAGSGSIGVFAQGNRVHAEHANLLDLVAFAFGMREFQVSGGPSWTRASLYDAERWEVDARAAGDGVPTTEQLRLMMQGLLANRFQLKVRHEQKEFPAYNLMIAKGGLKLKSNSGDGKFAANLNAAGRGIDMKASYAGLAWLTGQLSLYTGRPVFDQTGLEGTYDFQMKFLPEIPNGGQQADTDSGLPSVFTAVQEDLGLKLEPGMAPFDTVVIEHAEKPSAN